MVHWKALVESFAVVYVVSSECVCSLRYRPVDFGQMVDSKVPKVPLKVPIGQTIRHCGSVLRLNYMRVDAPKVPKYRQSTKYHSMAVGVGVGCRV